jgi:hypothetical protein
MKAQQYCVRIPGLPGGAAKPGFSRLQRLDDPDAWG